MAVGGKTRDGCSISALLLSLAGGLGIIPRSIGDKVWYAGKRKAVE